MTEKTSPFPSLLLCIRRVVLEYPLDVKTLALPTRGGGIRTRPLRAAESGRRAWSAAVSDGVWRALPWLPGCLQGPKELSDGPLFYPVNLGSPHLVLFSRLIIGHVGAISM